MNIEPIRGLVRPLVTMLFVGGFIYMALAQIEMPEAYTVMTGVIIAFYFKSRDDAKKP